MSGTRVSIVCTIFGTVLLTSSLIVLVKKNTKDQFAEEWAAFYNNISIPCDLESSIPYYRYNDYLNVEYVSSWTVNNITRQVIGEILFDSDKQYYCFLAKDNTTFWIGDAPDALPLIIKSERELLIIMTIIAAFLVFFCGTIMINRIIKELREAQLHRSLLATEEYLAL